MSHRYAAILAADVAHYSTLMEGDGEGTVQALKDCRKVFQRCVSEHNGREFGSVGDSLMAEFSSPVEALRAARDIQSELDSGNDDEVVSDRLQVRIGLHAGDVIGEGENLFGDVVNVASRLQQIANPGGVTMSELIHQQVRKEPGFAFRSLGTPQLKNIREPVKVYEVERRHHSLNWRRLRLAILPYKAAIAATTGVLIAGALIIAYLETRQPGVGGTIEITGTPQTSETPLADVKSIAVLPFADLSPGGDQEYFSDGLSEELLNMLSRVPGLRVVARSSSFQFKGENRDIIEIGRQLNVDHIVEGSVRRAGDNLRVTAQLINANDGFHLWSSSYDREYDDIFLVQQEISTAVVEALKEHVGIPVAEPPPVIAAANPEAHDAYLRGRFLIVQRTKSSIEDAIREFERAIALDPDYALAHAELAIATVYLKSQWDGNLTSAEVIARASPHVNRALSLGPDIAEIQYAAGLLLWTKGNSDEVLERLRRATRINPNYARAQTSLGSFLINEFGRYREGHEAWETAARLQPLSIPSQRNYVLSLVLTNRLEEAYRETEKIAAVYPHIAALYRALLSSQGGNWAAGCLGTLDSLKIEREQNWAWLMLSACYAAIGLEQEAVSVLAVAPWPFTLKMLGRPADALALAEKLAIRDPLLNRPRLAVALASTGDYAHARPILEEMWQRSGRRVTAEGLFREDGAVALIAIRRDVGDEAGISELLAAIKDDVRRRRDAGIARGRFFSHVDFVEGLAAYFAGEREKGLVLMAKGAEDGYFILPDESYLQSLYDDPGFAVILDDQRARQARERGKFLAVVCHDNPYAEFWQPAEGTCDRFAEAGRN